MVKHTQTIRWQLPTNFLNVFDHFVGLALKGLKNSVFQTLLKDRTEYLENYEFSASSILTYYTSLARRLNEKQEADKNK